MAQGYVPAERSLLLDYLWPLQMTSLRRAVKHRDISVVASITGFLLLKAIVFASTGLLVDVPTETQIPASLVQTSEFDESQLWRVITDDMGGRRLFFLEAIRNTYFNLSSAPVSAYLRSLDGNQGLGLGNVVQDITIPTLRTANATTNFIEISAQLLAFSPQVTCEVANVSYIHLYNSSTDLYALDSPSCSVGHWNWTNPAGKVVDQYQVIDADDQCVLGGTCGPNSLLYWYERVNCSDFDGNAWPGDNLTHETRGNVAYALVAVNLTNQNFRTVFRNNATYGDYDRNLVRSSAVICWMTYDMVDTTIVRNMQTNVITATLNKNGGSVKELADISALQLSELVYSIWPMIYNTGEPTIFNLMTRTLGNDVKQEVLFDHNVLKNLSQIVLKGVANQLMSTMSMSDSSTVIYGQGVVLENRLHFGKLSLWLMFTAGVVLAGLTIVIMWTTRRSYLTREPDSIASMALMVSCNPSVRKTLQFTGGAERRQLKRDLAGVFYRTEHKSSQITASQSMQLEEKSKVLPHTIKWTPYSARKHAMIMTLFFPLLTIVILEVLYQVSNQQNGLTTVGSEASAKAYVVRYISTLVVLGLATLYNALDFSVAAITPFSKLRSGSRTAASTLMITLLGSSPSVAFWKTLRHGHFGGACSSIASNVGSTLTIIVSGLWLVDSVPIRTTSSISLTSSWGTDWVNSSTQDNGAIGILDDIQYGRDVPPSHVLNDIVLPNFTTSGVVDSKSNYTYTLPALRPQLDCEVMTSTSDGSDPVNSMYTPVTSVYNLPPGCLAGPYGNTSLLSYTENQFEAASDSWIVEADFWGLHLTSGATNYYFETFDFDIQFHDDNSTLPDNPHGCPSLFGIFQFVSNFSGHESYEAPDADDYAAIICSQRLQLVPTEVTFVGDPKNMQITKHVLNESAAFFLTNGTDGVTAFPFQVEKHFSYLVCFRSECGEGHGYNDSGASPFFDHVIWGPNGLSLYDLAIPKGSYSGVNTTVLIKAMNELYNKYMTIAAHLNLKADTEASIQPEVIQGSKMTVVLRMKVDQTSKIVLQAQLAVMLVFGIATYVLVDLRGTLPGPPTSIGTVMSLLADSEMCDPKTGVFRHAYPDINDKDLAKSLEGWLFSLGWWEKRGKTVATEIEDSHAVKEAHTHASPISRSNEGKRFGIDIGKADTSNFTSSWSWLKLGGLRKRSQNMRTDKKPTSMASIWI